MLVCCFTPCGKVCVVFSDLTFLGSGLAGLVACHHAAFTVMTDYQELVVDLLRKNVEQIQIDLPQGAPEERLLLCPLYSPPP